MRQQFVAVIFMQAPNGWLYRRLGTFDRVLPSDIDEHDIRAGFGVDGPARCDYVSLDAKAMA